MSRPSKKIIIPPSLLPASYSQKQVSLLMSHMPPAKRQTCDSELLMRVGCLNAIAPQSSPSTTAASFGIIQVVLSERTHGNSGISTVEKDIRVYAFIKSSNNSSLTSPWLMPLAICNQTQHFRFNRYTSTISSLVLQFYDAPLLLGFFFSSYLFPPCAQSTTDYPQLFKVHFIHQEPTLK